MNPKIKLNLMITLMGKFIYISEALFKEYYDKQAFIRV